MVVDAAEPLTESLADFARRLNYKKSYITQLKQDGRLVLTADGKRVVVDASIELLKQTSDPSRNTVADRHAEARERSSDQPAPTAEENRIGSSYQASRAVKERFLALTAKRDYDISMGKLVDAEHVRHSITSAVITLRQRLELLPDTMASELAAEREEIKVRAILGDAIEVALDDLAREFTNLFKAQGGAA